jgi:hypothetical protein
MEGGIRMTITIEIDTRSKLSDVCHDVALLVSKHFGCYAKVYCTLMTEAVNGKEVEDGTN